MWFYAKSVKSHLDENSIITWFLSLFDHQNNIIINKNNNKKHIKLLDSSLLGLFMPT